MITPSENDDDNGTWVSTIENDHRIEYRWGDAAATQLPDNTVDVVNLQFVAHEMPAASILCDVLREAHRILKPASDDGVNASGQLWFCEMDFETPGYAAQRANPLLFALIRATEPYLDDYADHAIEIRQCLRETFDEITINPATGRHFGHRRGEAQQRVARVVGQVGNTDRPTIRRAGPVSSGRYPFKGMGEQGLELYICSALQTVCLQLSRKKSRHFAEKDEKSVIDFRKQKPSTSGFVTACTHSDSSSLRLS